MGGCESDGPSGQAGGKACVLDVGWETTKSPRPPGRGSSPFPLALRADAFHELAFQMGAHGVGDGDGFAGHEI
jgi:hypothetical protein